MHKSKLSTFVIDCKTGDLDAAATFWSRALGRPVKKPAADDHLYRDLQQPDDQPLLMVQKVDHPSRIHLDIESDDIEAEVKRLESIGAKRIEKVKSWVIMEAPTGQRFCVVKPQRGAMAKDANEWP